MTGPRLPRKAALALACSLAVPAPVAAQGFEPNGPDFPLVEGTEEERVDGSIAPLGEDRYLIAMQRYRRDPFQGTDSGIEIALFDRSGRRISGLFQANAYDTGSQRDPRVATGPDGSFVVVWTSDGSLGTDTSLGSVQARTFAAPGQPLDYEVQVNQQTFSTQSDGRVVGEPGGGFVVVWSGYIDGVRRVRARRLDAAGEPIGAEQPVSSAIAASRERPGGLDAQPDGTILVVWESDGSEGSDDDDESVQARLYRPADGFVGAAFQVNASTERGQREPAVAATPDGGFLVAWHDEARFDVAARRVASSGEAIGGELWMGFTAKEGPELAVDARGRALVSATDTARPPSDPSGSRVVVRAIDEGFELLGDAIQVNTYTPGTQRTAPLAMLGAGDGLALIAWDGFLFFGTHLRARPFRLVGPALWSDGFEQGSTTAWDEVQP